MGAINGALPKAKVRPDTRIRGIQCTSARPVLIYISEVWVLRSDTKSRITAAEMKFTRTTAGYTRMDRKKNEDILREPETGPILERIKKYQKN